MKTLFSVSSPLGPRHASTAIRNARKSRSPPTRSWLGTRMRMSSTFPMPILRKQKMDGSEEDICEEDLYRYTRNRWIVNEAERLAERYRKFNLPALIDVAIQAAGNGAQSCTKVLKSLESAYNKVFVLTLDNGTEIVARIPNPRAGPDFYITASEVATRDFLLNVLDVPVPRIYAHSFDSTNPVGAEYIIEEKAKGKSLRMCWETMTQDSKMELVSQVVDFEKKLTRLPLNSHGCIYYKKDLEGKQGNMPYEMMHQLALGAPLSTLPDDLRSQFVSDKFVIGPLTDPGLWSGTRATMPLYRGSWNSVYGYMTDLLNNEMCWIRTHAKPRVNPYNSLDTRDSPEDYMTVLLQWRELINNILPANIFTTLYHRNLHKDDIFADPETGNLTSVIGWHSTTVMEPYLQNEMPGFLLEGSVPIGLGDKTGAQEKRDRHEDLVRHYVALTKEKNQMRWNSIRLPGRELLTQPADLITGAWENSDIIALRTVVYSIVQQFDELSGLPVKCRVELTDEEVQRHWADAEHKRSLDEMVYRIHNAGLIPLGGVLEPEQYEDAAKWNDTFREMLANKASLSPQDAFFARNWPYQERHT